MNTDQSSANLSVPLIIHKEAVEFYCSINRNPKYAKVKEVYGSLPKFTARESSRLPKLALTELKEIVDELSASQISFNYALNSPVVTLKDLNQKIGDLLISLQKAGVETLTVSSPLAMEFIHKHFPKFNVVASTILGIDSAAKINQAKRYGSKRIVLDIKANRNIKFLKELKNIPGLEFEILVNEFCGDCLMRNCHYILQGIDSDFSSGDSYFDNFPYNVCSGMFMSRAEDILKGYWVIPEWMKEYQKLGIKWFKIAGRTINDLNWHRKVVEAYASGKYEGNILELGQVKRDINSETANKNVYIDKKILSQINYKRYY